MKDNEGKEVLTYQEIADMYGMSKVWFLKFKHKIEDPEIWMFKVYRKPNSKTVYLYKKEVIQTLKRFGYARKSR